MYIYKNKKAEVGLVKSVLNSVSAKPHRPVYRMHRYFARRPYNIFSEIILNFTKENDIILDPFLGGGVSLIEALSVGRKAVGFDINPLSTFITRMEAQDVNLDALIEEFSKLKSEYKNIDERLFSTKCRICNENAHVHWFEYSSKLACPHCGYTFLIENASKEKQGTWKCPSCSKSVKFSVQDKTKFELINVHYSCSVCSLTDIAKPDAFDLSLLREIEKELDEEEKNGLWLPDDSIPVCNMERESALHDKGIIKFRQLFSPRQLLALGLLKKTIVEGKYLLKDWLLFVFSSSLRYSNKMVTKNPSWRGTKPLEWSKPGFWLPQVFLEANVLEQFLNRSKAILKGKKDYLDRIYNQKSLFTILERPSIKEADSIEDLLSGESDYYIENRSSTELPLKDNSVDLVLTDPPYGSYVQYIDLSNFWTIWLPEIKGMGGLINPTEEAVISRKKFIGAKTTKDYQSLLEKIFFECYRVLKPNGYLIMTFNNREPRAWISVLVSIIKAGFSAEKDDFTYVGGISSYKHTSQSRRSGSIQGDFVLAFQKLESTNNQSACFSDIQHEFSEQKVVSLITEILRKSGPLKPDILMMHFYLEVLPLLVRIIRKAVFEKYFNLDKFLDEFDAIKIFDSHRKTLLEKYFHYTREDEWALKIE